MLQRIVHQATIWFGYIPVALFAFAGAAVLNENELARIQETTTQEQGEPNASSSSCASMEDSLIQVIKLQDEAFSILFMVGVCLLLGIYGTLAVATMLHQCRLPWWSTTLLSPPLLMVVQQALLSSYPSLADNLWRPLLSPGLCLMPFSLFAMFWMDLQDPHYHHDYTPIPSASRR